MHIPQLACMDYFSSAEKNKRGYLCTHDTINLHDYPCANIATYRHTVLELRMLLVLMRSSLSHYRAHSRLATLPSPIVGAVYKRLHICPMVTYLARLP
jgi:hypothetical protein